MNRIISKNTVSCFFFLVVPIMLLGQKNDYSKWNLKGKVKYIKESSFSVKEADGKNLPDTLQYYYLNEFNGAGNKTLDAKFLANGKPDKNYTYKYDNQNRRIEENQLDRDGKLIRTITYKYDSANRLTEDNSIEGNGKPGKKIIYHYNPNGSVSDDESYSGEGKLQKKFVYSYDDKGNLIESNRYTADGSPEKKYTFIYDQYNNIIEESSYKPDGSLISKNTNSFTYDLQGNWTEKIMTSAGKADQILIREITYFK